MWTDAWQDAVVHVESVSGSLHMLHSVSLWFVGGLYSPSESSLLCIVVMALFKMFLVVVPLTVRWYLALITHSMCMIARSHGKQSCGMALTHSHGTGKRASVYSSTRGPGMACSLFSGIQYGVPLIFFTLQKGPSLAMSVMGVVTGNSSCI